jgi:Raf kinase inhibitor-like YbhB/YbcL family protein
MVTHYALCISRALRIGVRFISIGTAITIATGPAWSVRSSNSMSLAFTSTAFKADSGIPATYTCDGDDVSPPLAWTGIPPATKSLALILDDPDAPDPAAPQTTWVHWVLYNLPANATELPQHATSGNLPSGTREGLNDWKRTGYGGPCPPIGRHRYIHKLYALDTVLPDLGKPTKADLEKAMQGHVIEKAELTGLYQRK